jgi:hypothetical protein
LWYIGAVNLEFEIKCRVTQEMKEHLEALASAEGSGVKISHLIRRALEKTYPPPSMTVKKDRKAA